MTELLKTGCPCEGRDQFGNTPLIIAGQNGNARIVKALLRHNANIDSQNKQGCTALHYCIAYGFNALSDYLIAKGANDKLLNKMGLSPYEVGGSVLGVEVLRVEGLGVRGRGFGVRIRV